MAPPLQQLEGKYEILQKLKEGGMGAIYKVRHRLLDEIRVVKVMRPHVALDESLRRRFLREAKIAIRVRHPNIAQLYDFSVDEEGTALIVMEFIDGATLQDLIRGGDPLDPALAVEIAVQSLQALSCLHHHEIVHRDIASDNLMLTRSFDGSPLVKLIDLGIAKDPVGEKTETGAFLGKARYSAPEQYRAGGAGALGPGADLYSFGVLFYELLTARLPYDGESFAEIASAHLFNPPIPFEKSDPGGRIPDGLREVVLRSLEKDPARRVSSAEEYIERLVVFRDPSRVHASAIDRLLGQAGSASAPAGVATPGVSSQELLDEHFPPGTGTSAPLPPAAPAPPPPLDQGLIETAAKSLDELFFPPKTERFTREILAVVGDEIDRRRLESEQLQKSAASAHAEEEARYQGWIETARREMEQDRFEEAIALRDRASALRPDGREVRDLEAEIRTRRAGRTSALAAECQRCLDLAEKEIEDEAVARRLLAEALRAQAGLRAAAGESAHVAMLGMLGREVERVGALLTERRVERKRRLELSLEQGLSELDRAQSVAGSAGGDLEAAVARYESARRHLALVLQQEPSHGKALGALERIDEALPILVKEIDGRRARAQELAALLEKAAGTLKGAARLEAREMPDLEERLTRLRSGRVSLEKARTLEPRNPEVQSLHERYEALEAETKQELDERRAARRRKEAEVRSTPVPEPSRPAKSKRLILMLSVVLALIAVAVSFVAWRVMTGEASSPAREVLDLPEDSQEALETKANAIAALARELPDDEELRAQRTRVLDLKEIQRRLDNLEDRRSVEETAGASEDRDPRIKNALLLWETLAEKLRPFLQSHAKDPTAQRILREALDHLRRLEEILRSPEIREKVSEAEELSQ